MLSMSDISCGKAFTGRLRIVALEYLKPQKGIFPFGIPSVRNLKGKKCYHLQMLEIYCDRKISSLVDKRNFANLLPMLLKSKERP